MKGFKVFTHDLCSPIQGGAPVWDGSLPFTLPQVEVDTSRAECAAGWNFTRDIGPGLYIAGLWPKGRPSRVFEVESTEKVYKRRNKLRSGQLIVLEEVAEDEINKAIYTLSAAFKNHQKHMAESQIAWRRALGRPHYDIRKIEEALREALDVRGLELWQLKRFDCAWDAWAARAAREAMDAWTARDAWTAWDAWEARAAWDAWEARAAWDAREVWEERAVRDAWAARDALILEFAALGSWITEKPDLLTRGLRTAYEHGLELAVPVDSNVLGWSAAR